MDSEALGSFYDVIQLGAFAVIAFAFLLFVFTLVGLIKLTPKGFAAWQEFVVDTHTKIDTAQTEARREYLSTQKAITDNFQKEIDRERSFCRELHESTLAKMEQLGEGCHRVQQEANEVMKEAAEALAAFQARAAGK